RVAVMSTKEIEKTQLLAHDFERTDSEDPNHRQEGLMRTGEKRMWSILQYCLLGLNASVLLISVTLNAYTWLSYPSRLEALAQCIHNTDMADAWPAIEYEERTFTGALVYDPTRKRVVRKSDSDTDYFGPPSKELDDRWDDLLRNEFPIMTEDEAAPFIPELVRVPKTNQFHFEPDVFHALHCVNMVRKEVSKSLYNVSSLEAQSSNSGIDLPEGWHLAHVEHCLDRLRQSVMCHGDLTPSPMYYWDGFGIALGRTGPHTCRKWQPIRSWMDGRASRGPLLDPV
ncbi:Cyclochlorotine biosynthesis protein R, partial [Pseudocercospora fuligena]